MDEKVLICPFAFKECGNECALFTVSGECVLKLIAQCLEVIAARQ